MTADRNQSRRQMRSPWSSLLAALVAINLIGCRESGPADNDQSRDESGAEVRERFQIVSLSPAISRSLVDFGFEEFVIGRTPWCTSLDDSIPIAGDLMEIDYERLIELDPTHGFTAFVITVGASAPRQGIADRDGFVRDDLVDVDVQPRTLCWNDGHRLRKAKQVIYEVVDDPSELSSGASGRRVRILQASACGECGHLFLPPAPRCPHCWSAELTTSALLGEGHVYSFAVYRRSYHAALPAPYVVAIVELAEGPRLISNIVGCPASEVEIDMPVRVRFDDVGDFTLPRFEPILPGEAESATRREGAAS